MINYKGEVEQITKADRDECHALCRTAKPAPRYGGLVPPFYPQNYFLGEEPEIVFT